jgi:hypothetical protein
MKLLNPDSTWVGGDEILDCEVVIAATREELVLLANGLTEALEAVDEWEFQTRLGGSPDAARGLRSKIRDLLRETRKTE